MTYYLLLSGVVLTSFLCGKKIRTGRKPKDGTKIYIILWAVVLVCMCGLRRVDVGRDTHMYSVTYGIMQSRSSWNEVLQNYNYLEFGFYAVEYIVSRFLNYQAFLFTCAIISIAPVMLVIYRYSENKMMSLFLFITFPYFTFCMSGLRQACALGLVMFAYIAVRERKLPMFLIFLALAFSFHTSAILFLPIYWIDRIPYKKPAIYASIGIMALSYVFKSVLWSIISQFARQQYTSNDAGGQMMYLFMILTVILGFYYRSKFTGENEDNKVLLYMQVLAAAIWPIASVNSAIARMYYYFHIYFILYVPTLIKSINGKIEKIVVNTGYYAVAIYFLMTQVLPEVYMFSPYHFFWS